MAKPMYLMMRFSKPVLDILEIGIYILGSSRNIQAG